MVLHHALAPRHARRRISARLALTAGGVLVFLAALHLWLFPLGRIIFLPFTDLALQADGVRVDPTLPHGVQLALARSVATARERVIALCGDLRSHPPIVAVAAPKYARLFGVSQTGTGVTHLSVLGSWMVLAPRGFNTDVIAHEWTHAEMRARLRTVGYDSVLPTWFSEGVAMQNDSRPEYSRRAYEQLLRTQPPCRLSDIATAEGFRKHRALAYMTAKFEVERWLAKAGRARFLALIDSVSRCEDFDRLYSAAESR